MSSTRFKRSAKDRILAGVCGGLGDYLGIDPTLVRLGFVALAFASGIGVPFYILLVIIAPSDSDFDDIEIHFPDEEREKREVESLPISPLPSVTGSIGDRNRFVAYGLIGFGAVMILSQFGWVSVSVIVPLLFIGAGIYFIKTRR